MFVRMFYPSSLVGQLGHSEYLLGNRNAACQPGRPPIGTYVMT
jgi:hypothetical protein